MLDALINPFRKARSRAAVGLGESGDELRVIWDFDLAFAVLLVSDDGLSNLPAIPGGFLIPGWLTI